jgi:hypothetical protein
MMATLIFHKVLLPSNVCLPCVEYAFNFGGKPMFDGIHFQLHSLLLITLFAYGLTYVHHVEKIKFQNAKG